MKTIGSILIYFLAFVLVPTAIAQDWPSYAADGASTKYSPLNQIDASNVKNLKVAWRWISPDEAIRKGNPDLKTFVNEATPLVVDGVLYTSTSMSQVAAINAATGKTLWIYDPKTYENGTPANIGFVHRGVSYWEDGQDHRIIYTTGDAYLIALNADTGRPIPSFGEEGRVDLTGLAQTDRSISLCLFFAPRHLS